MPRTFTVDLLALSEPFLEWCCARGKTRSAALRELVAAALVQAEKGAFSLTPDTRPSNSPLANTRVKEPQRERRFTLRLCDDDLKCLRRQSAAAGMPASRYLAALISTVESGGASIAGKDAVAALMQSNQQLAWIGRLLTNATRRSNGAPANPVILESDEMREALGLLRKHLTNAARVLAEVESSRCRRQENVHQPWRRREKTG